MISAKVIKDSTSPAGHRLTTMEVVCHRFVLAEFNTHRAFCLSGDNVLEFDLPSGAQSGRYRRSYMMKIEDFVDRWHYGAASRKNGGRYRQGQGTNRQPIRERLASMSIRQINERTGFIQTSTVTNCFFSGEKPVYQLKAGKFLLTGTAEHRIWTPLGYRTLGDLRGGDEIVVRRKGKRLEDRTDPNRFKRIEGAWRSVWQRKQRERLLEEFGCCQKCSSVQDLAIHHIVEVCVDPSLAYEESNILLLCSACHADQHKTQFWQAGQYLYGDAVVVDNVEKRGVEPTFDFEIAGEFPNFIANGVVVHNSRNSASSRAIPLAKQVKRIQEDPAIPIVWASEKPGMSGGAEVDDQEFTQDVWLDAADDAVTSALALAEAGVHKSICNRLLEPFMWHTIVVSATDWDGFWRQRCSPLAQPEMRLCAEAMKEAYDTSTPEPLMSHEWHLPYINWETEFDINWGINDLKKISAARCARVSYLTHDGQRDHEKDLELYEKLSTADPPHASPLEHIATPSDPDDNTRQGNFTGWRQLRHEVFPNY